LNTILHGILNADIRWGETIKDPQPIAPDGELDRIDRVMAKDFGDLLPREGHGDAHAAADAQRASGV
jgi:hypothetical protein